MTPQERFFEYAMAFEETFRDDDWGRLRPYFAEDATYEVRNVPFACVVRGREAILRALKKSIDGFDRRCRSRAVEVTDPPRTDGDTVSLGWAGTYEWPGAPALRFRGRSTATLDGPLIVRLVDEYPDGEGEHMMAWARDHAPEVDVSYV